jgi:hypothetical protein
MTMERAHHRDDDARDERDFPSEAAWLQLPAPEISAQFIDDTVARILADRELAEEAREPVELSRAALDAFAPPPVAADFVAATLARVQRDRHEHWRALLARYVAPEPSPEFVDRTVRALLPSPGLPARRSWLPMLLTAAAAVLLAVAMWPQPRRSTFEHAVSQAVPASLAMRYSATPLGTLTSLAETADEPFALPHAALDGAWLWQQSEGGGK